jgi:ubiquinol-cytochrome c reductase cytochrome b subunit
MLPFTITALAAAHILFLHQSGSRNPLGTNSNIAKTPFHTLYTTKDVLGILILLTTLSIIRFFFPLLLVDPENFLHANPLRTPTHIKPE